MAAPMMLLLPLLLLSVGSYSVPEFGSANVCNSDVIVNREGTRPIKTEEVNKYEEAEKIETEAYVKPMEGFEGVGLLVNDEHGTDHSTWFPLNYPDDQCLPQRGEWGEMEMGVKIYGTSSPYNIHFWVKYGTCFKACHEEHVYFSESPRPPSLSVRGYGHSEWKRTKPDDSCSIKPLSNTTHSLSTACLQYPQVPSTTRIATTNNPATTPLSYTTATSTTTPPTTTATSKATPSPHSRKPALANKESGTSGTAVVVVAWVVGMVVIVGTVVVSVMVVWRIRREKSPPHVITDTPQPGQPSRHSHVSTTNSLYEPFGNNEDGAATAGHRGSLHVSINSLYEPFTNPDNKQ